MSTATLPGRLPTVSKRGVLRWATLINVEILLLLGYLFVADAQVFDLASSRLYVYPFVWINVSLWALATVRPPDAPRWRKLFGGAVATGYALLLTYLGGLVSTAMTDAATLSIRPLVFPPGWAPVVSADLAGLSVTLLPYKVLGYITLSYLVYTLVVEAAGVLPAILGLFSCVSCVWAAVVVPLAGTIGGSTALATVVFGGGYDLSTAIFVVSVVLLAWRPTVGNRIDYRSGRW
ncbi:ABC transporter ATP-binding protein [Halorhabdus tiamatea SARL4B]|uniref:ABC transporter ATP-binding protein n=1 Tax=Halorhabdus tiamatea SARL4B TaxID=1033806 RepID=F7PFG7_9EURY|nr:hypothetical protein [Halorhabdus tiamatea]ERJ06463.1 ABC transporter ATP-binding protein [Halorhabdus tiamatea SARL4B]CCQ34372.1 conserved hypothetical membrane protein [Halorhabdus tiamatea SARL4B]